MANNKIPMHDPDPAGALVDEADIRNNPVGYLQRNADAEPAGQPAPERKVKAKSDK